MIDKIFISRQANRWKLWAEDFKSVHLYQNMMFEAEIDPATGKAYCPVHTVNLTLNLSKKELQRRLQVLEQEGLIRLEGENYQVLECKYVRYTTPPQDEE